MVAGVRAAGAPGGRRLTLRPAALRLCAHRTMTAHLPSALHSEGPEGRADLATPTVARPTLRLGSAGNEAGSSREVSWAYVVVQSCPALFDLMGCGTQASLSFPVPQSLLRLMPSNHLILCRPRLLLPSTFPGIRVFSNESALHISWPQYWSFSFSISPSSEHPGLMSFRMDWLELLAVQGTLKSLVQHHSPKASICRCSAFLMVQLSHPYMTTGKTIALTRQTFASKVMLLLFNLLSRLVIAVLPRGKHLLSSWLQSPSAVILEPEEIKLAPVSIFSFYLRRRG